MSLVYSQFQPIGAQKGDVPTRLRTLAEDIRHLPVEIGNGFTMDKCEDRGGRLLVSAFKLGAFADNKWRRWRDCVLEYIEHFCPHRHVHRFDSAFVSAYTILAMNHRGIAEDLQLPVPPMTTGGVKGRLATCCNYIADLIDAEAEKASTTDVTKRPLSRKPAGKKRKPEEWVMLVCALPENLVINTQADLARHLKISESAVSRAMANTTVQKAFRSHFPDAPKGVEFGKRQKSRYTTGQKLRSNRAFDG